MFPHRERRGWPHKGDNVGCERRRGTMKMEGMVLVALDGKEGKGKEREVR